MAKLIVGKGGEQELPLMTDRNERRQFTMAFSHNPAITLLDICTKELKTPFHMQKFILTHMDVYHSLIHKGPNSEASRVSLRRRMNNQTLHLQKMGYYSVVKNECPLKP